jgi:hypothetical protein
MSGVSGDVYAPYRTVMRVIASCLVPLGARLPDDEGVVVEGLCNQATSRWPLRVGNRVCSFRRLAFLGAIRLGRGSATAFPAHGLHAV